MQEEFVQLLKDLPPKAWNSKIDGNWLIKDVVAHLVGWEEEVVSQLPIIWKNKRKPSFLFLDEAGDDKFNQESLQKYSGFSSKELIIEWEKWIEIGKKEVKIIGKDNMKANPDLFSWWFDLSHYQEHFDQVKKTLV